MKKLIAFVVLTVGFFSIPSFAESTSLSTAPGTPTSVVPLPSVTSLTSDETVGATGAAGTSITTAPPASERSFLSKASLSIWGVYNGPALGRSSRFVSNPDGTQSSDKQNFDAILSAKYAISKNLSIAPVFAFMYVPVGGQEFAIKDPYLSASFKNLLPEGSRFDLTVDLRTYAGTSQSSLAKDRVLGIRSSQSLNYKLGRLTVGTYTFVRTNFYASDLPNQGNLSLYFAPNGSYQLTPKLAATIWYDMGATHLRGDRFMNFGSDGTTLQSGVNWDITESISVNPYLNFYPAEVVTLENTSLGMILSAKLL